MVILFSQKNIICQSLMITDDLKVYSVNEDAVRLLITMSQVRSLPGEPFLSRLIKFSFLRIEFFLQICAIRQGKNF